MASYGARYLQWAPFKASGADESEEAYPKYDAPLNLGALMAVTDSISLASGEVRGDDDVDSRVDEFESMTVDVDVVEMTGEVAAKVFGAALTEGQDVEYGVNDQSPYGGLAFYITKMSKNVKSYQGIYYPKVKASRQGTSYSTKSKTVSFANSKAHFEGFAAKNGRYQVQSKSFPTAAEAKAWVDKMVASSV